MSKYGGKLIATGSKSCVIKPNINCKGEKVNRNQAKISKIVFGDKSRIFVQRKTIDDIIKKIPGYKKWALIFDTLCKPPTFDESSKILIRYSIKCLGENSYENHMKVKIKKKKYMIKIVLC